MSHSQKFQKKCSNLYVCFSSLVFPMKKLITQLQQYWTRKLLHCYNKHLFVRTTNLWGENWARPEQVWRRLYIPMLVSTTCLSSYPRHHKGFRAPKKPRFCGPYGWKVWSSCFLLPRSPPTGMSSWVPAFFGTLPCSAICLHRLVASSQPASLARYKQSYKY